MYRAPTPPPPVDPRETAREPIKTAAGLQLGIAGLTFVSFTIYTLRFAFGWHAPGAEAEEVRKAILLYGTLGGGAVTLLLAAWGGLNFWGLRRMHVWARYSSIAFAGVTLAMCCFFPFSGFLLYLLLRADVKASFEK